MPRRSQKKTDTTTSQPATAPMITAPMGFTKAQGAVIATSPASMPLQHMVGSGLRPLSMSVTMADQRRDNASQHGVHHDEADAQVRPGKRRAGVEAEPAEGQNKGAQNDQGHAMPRHGLRPAISVILADAGADNAWRQRAR